MVDMYRNFAFKTNEGIIDNSSYYTQNIKKLKEVLNFSGSSNTDLSAYDPNKLPDVYITDDKTHIEVIIKIATDNLYYKLLYNREKESESKVTILSRYDEEKEKKLNPIRVYSYKDTHAYKESYSVENDQELLTEDAREFNKANVVKYINNFWDVCRIGEELEME